MDFCPLFSLLLHLNEVDTYDTHGHGKIYEIFIASTTLMVSLKFVIFEQ